MMTTQDLRRQLMQDFEDHRLGKITNAQARTRASLAKAICDTLKIEIVMSQANKAIYPVALMEQISALDRRQAA